MPSRECRVDSSPGHRRFATASLSLAGRDAFVEVRTAAWTLRGYARAAPVRVRAARWIAFGGVLYAGLSDRMQVKEARSGKIVLSAPDGTDDFTLAEGSGTTEVDCDAVSLQPDPDGVLRQSPPAPFQAPGTPRATP